MTTPSSHSGYREIARKALHPKTGIPSLSDWEVFLHGFTDTNMRGDSRRIYDCIIDLFPTPESVLDWPIGLDLPNTGGCENLQSRVSAGKWLRHNAANWETIAPLLRCRTPASQESVRDFVKPSKNQNKLLKKAMKGAKYKGADMHMLWGGCNVPVIDIQLMRYMAPEVLGMPWRPWVIEQLEAHKESGEPLLLNPGAPAKLQKWISAAEIDITEKTHISGEEKKQQAAIQGSVGRYGVWRDAAYRMADAEGLPANRWHVANWLEARAQGDPDKPETATRNQADTLRLAAVQQFSEYTFGPTKFPDAPATWPLPPERYEEKNPGSHLDTSFITYNIPDQWHDAIKLDRFRRQPYDGNVLFQVDGIMVNFSYYEEWNEFSLDIAREDFQEPSLANLIALKQFVYDMRDANPGVSFMIEATDAKRARVYQRAGFIPEIPIEDVEEDMDFHQMSLPGVPAAHRRPARTESSDSKNLVEGSDEWFREQARNIVDAYVSGGLTGNEAGSKVITLKRMLRERDMAQAKEEGTPFGLSVLYTQLEEVSEQLVGDYIEPAVYDKDYRGTPTWHREQISLIMRGQTGQTLRTSTAIAWLKRLREQALPKVGKYGVGKEWEHIVDILDMHLESFEGFGPSAHEEGHEEHIQRREPDPSCPLCNDLLFRNWVQSLQEDLIDFGISISIKRKGEEGKLFELEPIATAQEASGIPEETFYEEVVEMYRDGYTTGQAAELIEARIMHQPSRHSKPFIDISGLSEYASQIEALVG